MTEPVPRLPSVIYQLVTFTLLVSSTAWADVRMPGYYGDHMVLQQQMPLRIRGWADSGEQVTVSLAGNTATTEAGSDGRWTVTLPAMEASSTAVILSITGLNTISFKDVLIGEVWLCSGQSNMEWRVASSTNAPEETASAEYPLIRHIKFEHRASPVPLDDISADWQLCSPSTAENFTAVGYFMARDLYRELQVPIGLINSSWGGTRIEPWTPPTGFAQIRALSGLYRNILIRTPGTEKHKTLLQRHIHATERWLLEAKQALAADTEVPASPVYPSALSPLSNRQDPTALYNGMIHALVGFPIRGTIWYQGESNHTEGMLYYEKKRALINGWRKLWQQKDFPFYYVQIAPFQYGDEDPEILAELWEAQAAALTLPNTEMVVINDIATLDDIHPPNKQDVGRRLALLALQNDYGRERVARSPEFDEMTVSGKTLTITFRHTGGGLRTRNGQAPTHFEISGPNSDGYQTATARIRGDSVILSATNVSSPTAFRFAWHKLARPNLTGGTGLPVGAVRGGDASH
ncbi:MAG: sialate O-acetylesterase [Fuerstiella sp.]|nr:sialate O-acetylesterase [Fuerstiella sp.]